MTPDQIPVKLGAAKKAPIVPWPTPAYAWSGKHDPKLQTALDDAMGRDDVKNGLGLHPRVPFSMIALATDGNHREASHLGPEMDFSGSLLKLGVMYAAFELRAAANRLVTATPIDKVLPSIDEKNLTKALSDAFDSIINATAVRRVRNMPTGGGPKYGDIFTLTDLPPPKGPVAFSDTFNANLTNMIVDSGDDTAAACIRALGYAYINALFKQVGFFTGSGERRGDEGGIWIAGDYAQARQVRILAQNDGDGALVMNTDTMARLMALQELGALVDDRAVGGTSNQEMGKLVVAAVTGAFPPWISASVSHATRVGQEFWVNKNKLGAAGLGRGESGPAVASECSVLQWRTDSAKDPDGSIKKSIDAHGLTGLLVICWQNVRENEINQEFDAISHLVSHAYGDYLKTAP